MKKNALAGEQEPGKKKRIVLAPIPQDISRMLPLNCKSFEARMGGLEKASDFWSVNSLKEPVEQSLHIL
jgi:hypothetical protein